MPLFIFYLQVGGRKKMYYFFTCSWEVSDAAGRVGYVIASKIAWASKPYCEAGRGYLQSKHVLTPVSDPSSVSEVRFNEAHTKIHSIMWSTLSCMMRRFKLLLQLGFAKESCLDKKSNIIKACCVLHNIAKKFSVPSLPVGIEPVYPGKQHSGTRAVSDEALNAKQALISSVFSAPSCGKDALYELTKEGEV